MNYYIKEINSCESKIKDKIDILSRYGFDTKEYEEALAAIINNTNDSIESYSESCSDVAVKFVNEAKYSETLKRLKLLEDELSEKQVLVKIYFRISSLDNEVKKSIDYSSEKIDLYVEESKKILEESNHIKNASLSETKKITLDIYNAIYEVIKLELLANGKSSLLNYMLSNKIGLEFLNDLVREDIELLKQKDLYNSEVEKYVNEVSKEGIDYTYANEELILSITLLLDDRVNNRLKNRKVELKEEIDNFDKEKEENENKKDELEEKRYNKSRRHTRNRAQASIGAIILALTCIGYKAFPALTKRECTDVTYKTTREAYDTVSDETRSEEIYGKKDKDEFTKLKVYGPVNEDGKREVTSYSLSDLEFDDLSEYTEAISDSTSYKSRETIDYSFGEQLSREEYSIVEKLTYGEAKEEFNEEKYNKELVTIYRFCQIVGGASAMLLFTALLSSIITNKKIKDLNSSIKYREKTIDRYDEKIDELDSQIDDIDNHMREDNISTEEYKKLVLKR